MTVTGDNITVSLDNGSEIRGTLKGDGIEGRIYRGGKPIDRIWLVKRTDPIAWESNYALWHGRRLAARRFKSLSILPCR